MCASLTRASAARTGRSATDGRCPRKSPTRTRSPRRGRKWAIAISPARSAPSFSSSGSAPGAGAAPAAIHWTHRLFALVALAAVLAAAARAWRYARPLALTVAILVICQFVLGLANVALGLPLPLAAAHNALAALLVVALVVLNFFAFRGLRFFS